MRVCTFNTYQATTMPFRHRRLPGLYPALLYLSHHRVDVLCLQEQNSTRFGPLSYLLWRLALLFPFISHSPAMELLEYLGVAEGFLLPLFVADNKRHILQYAQQHTRFAHSVTVPPPRYFFDNGLIILSAHPIDEASTTRIHLRRDAGNRPGLIATNISLTPPDPSHPPLRVRLYNVHFVPSLLDVNVVFRTLNAINGMLGRDTRELRKEHFAVLMDDIRKWQVKDEQLMFIVAGDFNVSRGTSEEEHFTKMMREQAGLHAATMRPLKATACERTFSHEGQIDYIYVDSRIMARWAVYRHEAAAEPNSNGNEHDSEEGEQLQRHHVWPQHEAEELHSTRVETMFSSDHYPLLCDLPFLPTA